MYIISRFHRTDPAPLRWLKFVPSLLVTGRVLLGPMLVLMTVWGVAGTWLILGLTAAFLSDVLDGILARRLGVATERLRVADSWADGWFYLWIAAAVYWKEPEILQAFRVPLLVVISLQLFSYAVDLVKYRRIASFHAYTAKAWGIALFMATVALLGFHTGGVFLWLAILTGIVSNLDGLAIKFVLPQWQRDVPSVIHALRLRRTGKTSISPSL
jgi:CDP-diacylglycerol--glycerol-3-phosphate 3-phosphatidyltransferase